MVSVSEVWKPVKGYEGLYEISNLGRVKSLHRVVPMKNGRTKTVPEKIRIPQDSAGYPTVGLSKTDKQTWFAKIHWLVADAFIGPRPNKCDINHKSGIKTDNRVENLEYITRGENCTHAYKTGLRKPAKHPVGEDHHMAKLTTNIVREIRRRRPKESSLSLGREFGISREYVNAIARKVVWKSV